MFLEASSKTSRGASCGQHYLLPFLMVKLFEKMCPLVKVRAVRGVCSLRINQSHSVLLRAIILPDGGGGNLNTHADISLCIIGIRCQSCSGTSVPRVLLSCSNLVQWHFKAFQEWYSIQGPRGVFVLNVYICCSQVSLASFNSELKCKRDPRDKEPSPELDAFVKS